MFLIESWPEEMKLRRASASSALCLISSLAYLRYDANTRIVPCVVELPS